MMTKFFSVIAPSALVVLAGFTIEYVAFAATASCITPERLVYGVPAEQECPVGRRITAHEAAEMAELTRNQKSVPVY